MSRETVTKRCSACESVGVHPRHAGATAARLPGHRRRPYPSTTTAASTVVHRRLQPLLCQHQGAQSNVRVRARRVCDCVDDTTSLRARGTRRTRHDARDCTRSSFCQHRHARISRTRGNLNSALSPVSTSRVDGPS